MRADCVILSSDARGSAHATPEVAQHIQRLGVSVRVPMRAPIVYTLSTKQTESCAIPSNASNENG